MRLAAGCVLVAAPALSDPHFIQSVVFVMEHAAHGTLGFIVNRPVDSRLDALWSDAPAGLAASRIAGEGGPVERDKGLLLHGDPALAGAQPLGLGLAVGGEQAALAERWSGGPDHAGPRLLLGHSGWGPGQLERELTEGAWILRPGSPAILLAPAHDGHLWRRLLDGPAGQPAPSLN